MIQFIALTEMPYNRCVLINVASIVYVTKGRKEDTYIRVNAGTVEDDGKGLPRNFYFFVKEQVAEIQAMLMPPIMASLGDCHTYQDQLDRKYANQPSISRI